jgi:hypothetical protein
MRTRLDNVRHNAAKGAVFVGVPLMAMTALFETLAVHGNAYGTKSYELGMEHNCTFTFSQDEDGIDRARLRACASQNVTDWIWDTASHYANSRLADTAKIALPVIVVGSLLVGTCVGAIYGYCKQLNPTTPELQMVRLDSNRDLENTLPGTSVNPGQVPLLDARALNAGASATPVTAYARGTLFSPTVVLQDSRDRAAADAVDREIYHPLYPSI